MTSTGVDLEESSGFLRRKELDVLITISFWAMMAIANIAAIVLTFLFGVNIWERTADARQLRLPGYRPCKPGPFAWTMMTVLPVSIFVATWNLLANSSGLADDDSAIVAASLITFAVFACLGYAVERRSFARRRGMS